VNPIFLSLDEIIEIHRDQIKRYGGMSGIGIKLLKSALAMPFKIIEFLIFSDNITGIFFEYEKI